jgi:hypothetical protein
MTDAKERKAIFLECIDALLEHVKINTRMDIRDRIAALSLCDRVVAREKTDDDAERAGSKVREYAPTLQAASGARQGDRRAGTRDTRDTGDDEPADATADDTDDDAGIPVSH